MTSNRQLAAIMFCDIAGLSQMFDTDPSLVDKIRERHHQVFEDAHEKYHGKLIQQFGDTTLSIFSSPAEAVECAYFIQLELRRSPEIPLRVGIHSGEILQDGRGAYGDGLKVASRVERISEAGSIFITEKVQDDIKNHPWITTTALGKFKLEDVEREYELFTLTNRGLHVPMARPQPREQIAGRTNPPQRARPTYDFEEEKYDVEEGGKSKYITAVIALFLGSTGAHRFYLGQRWRGFLYAAVSGILMLISVEENAPIVLFMFLVGFVDAVLFMAMPKKEFDRKYNQDASTGRKREKNYTSTKSDNLASFKLLKSAVRKYDAKQYGKAVALFDKVLLKDEDNAAAHFYLACCFSMLKEVDEASYHLAFAVRSGFDDFERIENDRALQNFRAGKKYLAFREDYMGFVPTQETPSLPSPQEGLLDKKPDISSYEKIELLGDRLANGELSAAEFELEKTRILNP